ncbi:MAG: UbiA-like polyprenyltransferase [Acidobacteriota bacterium]
MVLRPFARRLWAVLDMIKVHHTVFALPFALLAMLWAARGWPSWPVFGWILLAMVAARSAAMTFNRIADRRYDVENPRTSRWPLSTGAVSLPFAWGFLAVCVLLLLLAAWRLNPLCLALAPLALAVLLGYSLTKRFTVFCHLFLGFADGISAPGAWIAVTGTLHGSASAWWLCGAMTTWIGGFDLLYALQDLAFDREKGLYSFPARYGVRPGLRLSTAAHLATVACLVAAGLGAGAGWLFYAGVAATLLLLLYEHSLVKPGDLSRLGKAFFTVNGYIAIGLFLVAAADLWMGNR